MLEQFKTGMLILACACFLQFNTVACDPKGTVGHTNEWVKGKAISVKAIFTSGGRGADFNEPLVLGIRNDGSKPVHVVPIEVTGWFERAGKVKGIHTYPNFSSGLVSSTLVVRVPPSQKRDLKLDRTSSDIVLNPQEEIQIPFLGIWGPNITSFDVLERVRIAVGPDRGAEQEIFSIR